MKPSFLSSLRVKCRIIQAYLNLFLYISILITTICLSFWFDEIVPKLSGKIEENPGPKTSQSFSMSLKSNITSAQKYIKTSLLRAYISNHKFEVSCISESYLDSDTSNDSDNLEIAVYNLIWVDHPLKN